MTSDDCLFCLIVEGTIPADVVAETDHVLAFRDIAPKAPTHVLVVPKGHSVSVVELAMTQPEVLAELVAVGSKIAQDEAAGEFQLVFNTGASVGQTVFHTHGHVLGGSMMSLGSE